MDEEEDIVSQQIGLAIKRMLESLSPEERQRKDISIRAEFLAHLLNDALVEATMVLGAPFYFEASPERFIAVLCGYMLSKEGMPIINAYYDAYKNDHETKNKLLNEHGIDISGLSTATQDQIILVLGFADKNQMIANIRSIQKQGIIDEKMTHSLLDFVDKGDVAQKLEELAVSFRVPAVTYENWQGECKKKTMQTLRRIKSDSKERGRSN